MDTLGWALLQNGQKERALSVLKDARKQGGNNPEIRYHFAAALAQSGQTALARVLQRWVLHLLGVAVQITPLARIDAPQHSWLLGLDAEATAILNDLYGGVDVAPERLDRLIGLFRLDFADPTDLRADLAGTPVYLGLAMDADGGLRIKPQNLVLNLPLARAS